MVRRRLDEEVRRVRNIRRIARYDIVKGVRTA